LAFEAALTASGSLRRRRTLQVAPAARNNHDGAARKAPCKRLHRTIAEPHHTSLGGGDDIVVLDLFRAMYLYVAAFECRAGRGRADECDPTDNELPVCFVFRAGLAGS
jgi:hypothetical protein